jgi:predicted  nucleic acid-binding Zn-ribbon protein
MKAIELLQYIKDGMEIGYPPKHIINNAIKEIEEFEAYKTNYQGAKRRLESTIKTLAVFENENKSLVKTLEKYNEEMIDLRKENQDLKNSNNELLEGLKSTQKRLEEWLEKCK